MRYLLLLALSLGCYAQDTVTAVTNSLGSMQTVTIQSDIDTARYSNCYNQTPYTYPWHVDDLVNVSVNFGTTAWTLNDLTTAAVAVCIVRTVL